MQKKDNNSKLMRICVVASISVLCLMFAYMFVFLFTGKIFVNKLGTDNVIIDTILGGNRDYFTGYGTENEKEESVNKENVIDIDWEELYPHYEEDLRTENTNSQKAEDDWSISGIAPVKKYLDFVEKTENSIKLFSSELMIGYRRIAEISKIYNELIKWDVIAYDEYNGVYTISDGYLTLYDHRKDVKDSIDSLSNINKFCNEKNIDFLYVQAPSKICKIEDSEISGTEEFANQNADDLLAGIEKYGVKYIDLRELLHSDGYIHHDVFFKTDHHWKPSTGLWAAQRIMEFCNDNYGWKADTELLNINNFNIKTYKDWFLGAQGKKVTLSHAKPEDIELIYPRYDTAFNIIIPSKQIDDTGDFSVIFDMEQIEPKDYYNQNSYAAYNYGDNPLMHLTNEKASEEHKILIIKDSFSNCMAPYMTLTEKYVDLIDARYYTGSIKRYIDETKPDLVIIMSICDLIQENIDLTTHKNSFDYR